MDAPHVARGAARQRGFDAQAVGQRQRVLHGAAEGALQVKLAACGRERSLAAVHHQLAAGGEVAVRTGFGQQLLQRLAAFLGQGEQGGGAVRRHVGAAGGQEAQAPEPLRRVQAQA